MRGARIALISSLTASSACLVLGSPAAAQAPTTTTAANPPPQEQTRDKGGGEVVVIGHHERGAAEGDPAPVMQLGPNEILSYGVDTVADLLEALKPQADTGAGAPIVLLNGRRIAGFAVVKDLPTEAIARVDILPAAEALRYGYPPTARVINIVLREPFVAVTVDAEEDGATEGGAWAAKADLGLTRLAQDTRLTLDLKLEDDARLLASERGVQVAPALEPAAVGALVEPNVRDLGSYETLRPATQKEALSVVVSRPLVGSVSATLDASVALTRTEAEHGLASAALQIPRDDPFAPASAAVELLRYLPEAGPLQEHSQEMVSHLGLELDGAWPGGIWSLTGSANHDMQRDATETGIDLSEVQARLDAGDAELNLFAPLPTALLGGRLTDRTRSTSDTGTADWVVNGVLGRLPAGSVAATFKLGGDASRFASMASDPSAATPSAALARTEGRAGLNLDLPLTSRSRGVAAALGDLTADLGAEVDEVSDFGALRNLFAGLSWRPDPRVALHGSWTIQDQAPTMIQLGSPTLVIPNVVAFDYLTGQSVQVIELSGGDPHLASARSQTIRVNLTVNPVPPLLWLTTLTHTQTDDPAEPLPPPSAAVEAAFPDRFMRVGGVLTEINAQPVNFARETRDQLRWGLVYTAQGGPPPGARSGARGGAEGDATILSLFDTWAVRDTVLIRPGLPAVDLLNGGSVAQAGGPPVHTVEAQALMSRSGVGAMLTGKWQAPTWADNGSAAGNLYFSDLLTANLRLFASLGVMPALAQAAWAKGVRATLAVDNLTDARVRVRSGLGVIPQSYQGAYLDPVGRLVKGELRKVF